MKPFSNKHLKSTLPQNSIDKYSFLLGVIIIFFSIIVLIVNTLVKHYPFIIYIPTETPIIVLSCFLIYSGCKLMFGTRAYVTDVFFELFLYTSVFACMAICVTAIQLTPFPPIDSDILTIEHFFNIHLEDIMAWSSAQPLLKLVFFIFYDTLSLQLVIIPIMVILLRQHKLIHEFYYLFLFTMLTRATIYYFFPTTAPASNILSPHFIQQQYDTGLKFAQLHSHKLPTTSEGGMIAFPSFHVIWAWLCVNLVRPWRLAFSLLLLINIVLAVACVATGWHYAVDIIGSIAIILLGHVSYQLIKGKQAYSRLMRSLHLV